MTSTLRVVEGGRLGGNAGPKSSPRGESRHSSHTPDEAAAGASEGAPVALRLHDPRIAAAETRGATYGVLAGLEIASSLSPDELQSLIAYMKEKQK